MVPMLAVKDTEFEKCELCQRTPLIFSEYSSQNLFVNLNRCLYFPFQECPSRFYPPWYIQATRFLLFGKPYEADEGSLFFGIVFEHQLIQLHGLLEKSLVLIRVCDLGQHKMISLIIRGAVIESIKILPGPDIIAHLIVIMPQIEGDLRISVLLLRACDAQFREHFEGSAKVVAFIEDLGYFDLGFCFLTSIRIALNHRFQNGNGLFCLFLQTQYPGLPQQCFERFARIWILFADDIVTGECLIIVPELEE